LHARGLLAAHAAFDVDVGGAPGVGLLRRGEAAGGDRARLLAPLGLALVARDGRLGAASVRRLAAPPGSRLRAHAGLALVRPVLAAQLGTRPDEAAGVLPLLVA